MMDEVEHALSSEEEKDEIHLFPLTRDNVGEGGDGAEEGEEKRMKSKKWWIIG